MSDLSAQFLTELTLSGPLALWPLQEASGNPQDVLGSADVTGVGGTPVYAQAGPMGDSAIVLGGGSYFQGTTIGNAVNNIAFFCWVKVEAGTEDNLFSNGDLGGNGWGLRVGDPNPRGIAGGVAFLTASSSAMTDDVWYQLVLERRAGTWTYYLNGVGAGTGGTTAPNPPSGGQFLIGSTVAVQVRVAYCAYYTTLPDPSVWEDLYIAGTELLTGNARTLTGVGS